MSDPIRVGLVGYGYAGETFHAPVIAATPGLELAVVGSGRPDKVRARFAAARVVADPQALIADATVDLVVIATPNDTHAPLAGAALLAGKHVVVDKPFTLTVDEARALIEQAEQRDQLLSVFHNRRWDSDFLTVKRAIEGGFLGEVVAVESRIDRWRPQVRERWRESAGPGAGLLYDLSPHLIDQMLCLFGLPDQVSADIGQQRPGAQADDWFRMTLHWGARTATLSAAMLVGGGTPRWLVHGTAGTLRKDRIDGQEEQLKAGMIPGAPGWGLDPDPALLWTGVAEPKLVPAAAGDQRAFYAGIAGALRGSAANPVPARQALATMVVLEAARHAAEQRRTETLAWSEADRAAWAS